MERDGEELVAAYETDRHGTVAVVKMALRDADVPFIAVNDVVSGFCPVDGMAIVSFQVCRDDLERARAVLVKLGLQ